MLNSVIKPFHISLKTFKISYNNFITFEMSNKSFMFQQKQYSTQEMLLEASVSTESGCSFSNDVEEIKQLISRLSQLLIARRELERIGEQVVDKNIVKLNIGGTFFTTLKQTLEKSCESSSKSDTYGPNVFQDMLEGRSPLRIDETGAIFIDRNPQYFSHVLDFLRLESSYKLPVTNELLKSVFDEAQFYKIEPLKDKIYSKCINSSILNEQLSVRLFRTCNLKAQRWSLIYKASRDGFSAEAFHAKCDSCFPTLTIAKTSLGFVFGGCAMKSWDKSHDGYREDSQAFLFSLANRLNKPVKIEVKNGKRATVAKAKFGPTFGEDDLAIFAPPPTPPMPLTFYDNYNRYKQSYICKTNISKSFQLSEEILSESQTDTFLAGSLTFTPVEVEVFVIAQ